MKQYFKHRMIILSRIILVFYLLSPLCSNSWVYGQGQQRTQTRNRLGQPEKPLNIVCSFSDYASITRFIAGDRANVSFIAQGEQDPHFVPPKPSYAVTLSTADMWITTGMDLEMWSATLLDKARNKKIMDGEIGFVSVSG
ncbi:MAG: zinc ABC transporter substrate-binding protein, partial [Bacteroidales bacterium]